MSLLEGYAANLLQDSQVMAHCLDAQAFLYHDKLLKFPDELLVELAESKVGYLEPAADEVSETVAGVKVVGQGAVRHIDTCSALTSPICLSKSLSKVIRVSLLP